MKDSNTLTLEMINTANNKIKDYINKTPLIQSTYLSDDNTSVYYKLENTHQTRAFKIRGALNKMLSLNENEKNNGVATISSGNHGISVAMGAKLLGIEKALIIVPENTSEAKLDKIKYYGGKIVLLGKNYDEAHIKGMKYISDKDLTFIDSYYDDETVYAGQGTVMIEILEQLKDVDVVLAPIGGGGLISGISVAAKETNPNIKVYGVQTEACPAMKASLNDDICYEEYETEDSICESLVGGIGTLSFEICKKYIDDVLLVSESQIREATAFMVLKELIIIEPSSATVIAAFKRYKNLFKGKKTVLVISGGNPHVNLMVDIFNEYKDKFND